jgi:hypothetical protein
LYNYLVCNGKALLSRDVVAGQTRRLGHRQVQLAGALAGCRTVPVGLHTSKAAGSLCARSGTADAVDAIVVVIAAALRAIIWTSDTQDIKALADQSGVKPAPVVRGV